MFHANCSPVICTTSASLAGGMRFHVRPTTGSRTEQGNPFDHGDADLDVGRPV
jgi:hypothetical protein